MKIRTNIKHGDGEGAATNRITANHNEKIAKDNKSLVVKTGIKAGADDPPIIRGTAK